MGLFIDVLAAFCLVGVICTGVLGAGIGGAMGTVLLAGLIDGPQGGRLEARALKRDAARVTGQGLEATPHVPSESRQTA